MKRYYDGPEITEEDFQSILDKHKKWLRGQSGGSRADLRSADLSGADLRSADLSGADLRSADLSGADLRSAVLSGATYLPAFQLCPEVGAFQCWKKVYSLSHNRSIILLMEVPADAKRTSSLIGRKCRAESVTVIRAENCDGTPCEETEFCSGHDGKFRYRVGKASGVNDFDDDIRVECTRGLHFFVTRAEAVEY
jgi:hypothetical protein